MKRRILRLRINEISGVDDPAQEGARAVIMKRAEPVEEEKDIRNMTTSQVTVSKEKLVETVSKEEAEKASNDAVAEALASHFENVVTLTGDALEHYKSLSPPDQEDFLSKSVADREVAMRASMESDPVMYTTSDGIELRKSAGDVAISLAKRNDELSKAVAELNAVRVTEQLVKRAESDLAHMPGGVEHRVSLLRAVDGIGDKDTRQSVLEILRANNDRMAKAFEQSGVTGIPSPSADSPEGRLDLMVEKLRKSKPDMTPGAGHGFGVVHTGRSSRIRRDPGAWDSLEVGIHHGNI